MWHSDSGMYRVHGSHQDRIDRQPSARRCPCELTLRREWRNAGTTSSVSPDGLRRGRTLSFFSSTQINLAPQVRPRLCEERKHHRLRSACHNDQDRAFYFSLPTCRPPLAVRCPPLATCCPPPDNRCLPGPAACFPLLATSLSRCRAASLPRCLDAPRPHCLLPATNHLPPTTHCGLLDAGC